MVEPTLETSPPNVRSFSAGDDPEPWIALTDELSRLWLGKDNLAVMVEAGVVGVHAKRRATGDLYFAEGWAGLTITRRKIGVDELESSVIPVLVPSGTCVLKVFLRGEQHDYTFYCLGGSPETILDALNVASVMCV